MPTSTAAVTSAIARRRSAAVCTATGAASTAGVALAQAINVATAKSDSPATAHCRGASPQGQRSLLSGPSTAWAASMTSGMVGWTMSHGIFSAA